MSSPRCTNMRSTLFKVSRHHVGALHMSPHMIVSARQTLDVQQRTAESG